MKRFPLPLIAGAVLIAVFGGSAVPGPSGAAPRSTVPRAPLATSLSTTLGTWATVPMGNLHQPLNTFWQLFFLSAGGSSWTNQVAATATATNGGLVLSSSNAEPLVVGVRPSQQLRYSPLISTSDAGGSWTNGLVFPGLADLPEALALGPNGQAMALVEGDHMTEVLANDAGLSRWQTLATQSELTRSQGGRRCGLLSVGATAFLGGVPVLGVGCARHRVGVLRLEDGRWVLVGPVVPATFGSGPVAVLSMVQAANDSMTILFAVDHGGRLSLGAAWTADGGKTWTVSARLRLSDQQLESVGSTGPGGLFVLSGSSGSPHANLHIIAGPGARWLTLVSPPPGTATVAFAPNTPPEALAVSGITLQVSELSPDSTHWSPLQLLRVPIQFGSSS
jgi:hypothetical protein